MIPNSRGRETLSVDNRSLTNDTFCMLPSSHDIRIYNIRNEIGSVLISHWTGGSVIVGAYAQAQLKID